MRDQGRPKVLRCGIYTRKSSEEGLEQDFNSLHAQREACEAYIKSQKHEGWQAIPGRYDDGGFSGGSMERPALQKLLADIQAQRVDVVVVYKVDRLTRSLADFAKIVEVFDAQGVSFVSVTQQFNTTSSMGRLTLNVLLSFAQFEREVTGERIRDKIAASKRKGLWMGGWPPIGYDARDRTLVINKAEAGTVRAIYSLYLKYKNVRLVHAEVHRLKLTTKRYLATTGRAIGGRPFSRGHIYRILSNPLYIGEIEHKGARHPGQHDVIIDRETWKAVQVQLSANARQHNAKPRVGEPNLFAGLLVDAQGARFASSHTAKNRKRYRYYVGTRIERGQSQSWRMPAHDLETAVVRELRSFLDDQQRVADALSSQPLKVNELEHALYEAKQLADAAKKPAEQREMVLKLVKQVQMSEAGAVIEFKLAALLPDICDSLVEATHLLEVPVELRPTAGETAIIISGRFDHEATVNPTLLKAIARGFTWFGELQFGRAETVTSIAKRERVTDRYVSQLIELAFLSPRVVEKTLIRGPDRPLSVKQLVLDIKLDLLWSVQERQVFPNARQE